MPLRPDRKPLAQRLGDGLETRWLADGHRRVTLAEAAQGALAGCELTRFAGRNVMIAVTHQLDAALALIALDGTAARILLAPPDLLAEHRAPILADAEIDAVIADDLLPWSELGVGVVAQPFWPLPAGTHQNPPMASQDTKWLMLTSGTTGRPKIVAHTLDGLTGAIAGSTAANPVWATFYDIRRYGGLQILLRALVGGGSLVLSEPHETLVDHLARLSAAGVTHISGTPSHWRKALMSDALAAFKPNYVRLSGEIADQAVLDSLRKTIPNAAIGHAYASTEAGVGFAVDDGLEGFPASLVGKPGHVEMKVVDGTLFIRSQRAALTYVGEAAPVLLDAEGFVDTGDMVELRGQRYYFVGRKGGIINVGGLKVHPEEVEAALNMHPAVRMSRVKSRKSPFTGAIVVADVVLSDGYENIPDIKNDIMASARAKLPAHKVPALISLVPVIEVSANGKLVRHLA
ncbi:class I adenylate-forming enzyme family protein [Aestuariivirga litoralis]|uniref:class I adenylate-forming enzyme family protein n=1 Tax=Aestuariivirga litoralis TaxID=2650924 RepID=UPI0018C47B49|nr:AMP-binding protein [Aestuariivirga litoralis]MBG1233863.1 long-chain fatty acid--CoA ligase [Aestuariivirga litoralis]